jgi:RHS repeat-associated protein
MNQVVAAIGTTSYTFDSRGNRLTVTDANNGVTRFSYDRANRLLSETNPINQATTYTYDAAGNRKTKLDGNGKTTTYSYDANRRLKTVTFQDGSTYQFDYDDRGNRTLELNSAHERHLLYDELNRIKQTTDTTLNKVLSYTYDASGKRASLTVDGLVTSYSYDSLNRLTQVTDPDGDQTFLTYDLAGNRSRLTLGNGVVAKYDYDNAERLTSIGYTNMQGQVLQSFGYTLDPVGNRLQKKFADGSAETYVYDVLNRLTKVTYGSNRTVAYTLDALGNFASVVENDPDGTQITENRTSNAFNQITSLQKTAIKNSAVLSSSSTSFAFDGNGNLISQAATQNGSISTTTYSYDLDNRLRQVGLPGGRFDSFEYDADGLRTYKVDSAGATNYLLDGPSVVAEYEGSANLTALHVNNPQYIDEQFSLIVGQAASSTKKWPVTDALGSVYAWMGRSGSEQDTYVYDVYGLQTQARGSDSIAWGFTGREHDGEDGLNYNRDRYANPGLGMWTQPDRSRFADEMNPYRFVLSNPVNLIDPLGLWAQGPVYKILLKLEFMFEHEDYRDYAIYFAIELSIGLGAIKAGSALWNVGGDILSIAKSSEFVLPELFSFFGLQIIIEFTAIEGIIVSGIGLAVVAIGVFIFLDTIDDIRIFPLDGYECQYV